MKSFKKHFVLESGEYLIGAGHQDAIDYKIYFKGKECEDVVGLIRMILPKEVKKKIKEDDKKVRKLNPLADLDLLYEKEPQWWKKLIYWIKSKTIYPIGRLLGSERK